MILAPLLLAGCTHLPEVNGMPLPKLSGQAPAHYPSLTDIPDAPAITPVNQSDAAIRALSGERGSNEHAARALEEEPFMMPVPAPPPMPF
jgi:hypothetical protein